jgi:hypothetical protein
MDNQPTPDPVPSAPPSPEQVATPVPSASSVAPAPVAAPAAAAPAAAPVPAAVPSPKESLTSIQQNISNLQQSAMDAVTKPFTAGSPAVPSLVVGSAIAFLVAFVLYWVISRGANPLTKITFQVPDSKTPKTGYEVNQLNTEGLPSLKNTATVSFWLYVNEFPDVIPSVPGNTTAAVNYRHIWHRGDIKWSPELVSPLVLLKSTKTASSVQTNSLVITFPSTDKTKLFDGTSFTNTDPPRTTKIDYMLATRGITIDYIPIKRWVHVAVTVDKKKKMMKAFVDGQLVNTIDNTKVTRMRTNTSQPIKNISRKLDLLELNGSGDIYIGGRPTSDLGLGFPGLVSNIRFSNWDMSTSEVYREYKRGPVENLMSKIGLPAYGLQSPIYKML